MAGGIKTKGSVKAQGSSALSRVDFDPVKLENLVETKGYNVTWEKAMFCPKVRGANPTDHDIGCNVCDGSGFIFYDEVATRMHMQSLAIEEQYFAYGRFDSGKVQVTPRAECVLSFWDKITLCESTSRFAELIHRRPGTLSDRPKYDVLELLNVTWADRNGDLVTYILGEEVTYDADTGELTWLGDNRPDDGSYYSVAYLYHPEYQVIDMVHNIRDTQVTAGGNHVDLSRQAVAQLRFLIRDEGEDIDAKDKPVNPF